MQVSAQFSDSIDNKGTISDVKCITTVKSRLRHKGTSHTQNTTTDPLKSYIVRHRT